MPNQNTPITIDKSFASQDKAKYWHPNLNEDLMPKDFTIKSGKKCWFECNNCKHDFDSTPGRIYKGSWCPYCSIPSKKLCEDKTCKHCFDKSFASHEKANNWHPTKNDKKTPRNVLKGSNQEYCFECHDCDHDYNMLLPNVVKNQGCPYCSGRRRCEKEDCEPCFNRSFASQEKSKFWHPTKNGNTKPRDVATSGNSQYYFKCEDCNHDLKMSLSNIKAGNWCSYCCEPCQKLCEDESCEHCFKNSFASCEKAKYWHQTLNGNINPRDMIKGGEIPCWFKCEKKHDFESNPYRVGSGKWCPVCVNKTEKKLLEFLNKQYPNEIVFQPKYNWCKNPDTNRYLPFDYEVFGLIIIELDGPQHIDKQISNWKSVEEQQERDMYKMEQAINNGKHLIRILQEDVLNDKNNWKEKLIQEILILKDDSDTKIRFIGECHVYREYTIE